MNESTNTPKVGDEVRVIGAPGYADFAATLLMLPADDWPVRKATVGYAWKGKQEFAVVPLECIQPAGGE